MYTKPTSRTVFLETAAELTGIALCYAGAAAMLLYMAAHLPAKLVF